jgi:hypothetical protein
LVARSNSVPSFGVRGEDIRTGWRVKQGPAGTQALGRLKAGPHDRRWQERIVPLVRAATRAAGTIDSAHLVFVDAGAVLVKADLEVGLHVSFEPGSIFDRP